ncbi:LuxR C-terminal-related transcriptional regulator [Microvirga pakistanensis]|uniref:LuxR C-terminal-related transcriptional regulator n=1 Tax=Microvirga pakistanensis TaxID=1682650 RepID=UPI00106A0E07|nr:response regulator transcription factor [Microvirga pakistanensis]
MTARTISLVRDRSSQIDDPFSIPDPVIRTALISDNLLLSSGLQHILQGTPFVLAEMASVADLDRLQNLALEPALVIIDANRTTGRVFQVAKQAKEQFPAVSIVALADQFDLGFVLRGHEAGITGFCSAASAPEVLIKSLELVMLGQGMVPSAILDSIALDTAQLENRSAQNNSVAEASLSDLKACKLSTREMEVLDCLREGASNKAIARNLDITEATIKVHVKTILRKIGASNRTQAAMWASQRLRRTEVSALNV